MTLHAAQAADDLRIIALAHIDPRAFGPLQIPVYWQSLDGTVARVQGHLTQGQLEDKAYDMLRSRFLSNNAEFVLNAKSGRLVIQDVNANNAG